jgi:hypothetical protein
MTSTLSALAFARPAQINDDLVTGAASGLEGWIASLGLPGWLGTVLTVLAILVIGFIIAGIVRSIISKVINATPFGRKAQTSGGNIGKAVGKAAFWLIMLYTLFVALSRLSFADSALAPVGSLLEDIGTFIPKLIAAGFIAFIGYIVSRVAKTATTSTLDAAGVDGIMSRSGVTSATGSTGSISNALGTIVFVLILVPVIIAALDVLNIESISGPLTGMLETFLEFIPRIIGAAIILGIAVMIGRFIRNFLEGILPTFGFDNSINEVMMLDDGEGLKTPPSRIVGTIAYIVVIVLGLAAAISVLGIESLDDAFGSIVDLGGRVLTAAVTVIAGVFLANFVARIVGGATESAMGRFLKYAIILLVSFMALSQLGIGESIVNGLFLSIAIGASIAGALAFGIGGKDWAHDMLNQLAPPKDTAKKLQGSNSRAATTVKAAAARKRTTAPRAKKK